MIARRRSLLIVFAVLTLLSSACFCGLFDDPEDGYNPDPSSEKIIETDAPV